MHTLIKAQIIALAEQTPTVEVCGFIALNPLPLVVPCPNVSPTPDTSFQIAPSDYLRAKSQGQLVGMYHSHPRAGGFSDADLHYSTELALPLYLYNVETKAWSDHIPSTYVVPLTGRQFCWGFNDCFGCVRDYYRQECGIPIRDYDRDDHFQANKDRRMWDNFEKEGFVKIEGLGQMKKHDALIFATNAMPQHVGVFKGNSRILHHPLNSLSRIDLFNSNWQRRLKAVVRHRTLF
jgi:proteasome lid subunit RPN8/RPN11